ncbi:MAG: sugar ABC transporter substrate-binding protein, partial [Butyricicoccaceae bacterium]
PSLKISRIFYTDITMSDGYESGKELAGQKVDGVFCTSAVIGLGVATAFTETAQEAVIVAVDTQDDALQALQDGTMNALISQSGYEIGYRAINIAVNTLKNGKMPENVLIPVELLTKDSE